MKEPIDRSLPYVSDLLEAERAAPPPGQEVQDRVRARVAATLIAATTTGAATTAAAAKAASAGVLASLATKATLIVVLVASAGATGGAVLHRRQARARARALAVAPTPPHATHPVASPALSTVAVTPPAVPAPVALPPAAAPELEPAPPAAERRHHRVVAPPSSEDRGPGTNPSETAEELADENRLIEAARAALGAHDARSAADLLERHARLHPAGQMEEEREALWVQALAAEGDGAAARARAAIFRRRFPGSIQLEVVSAALDTIP
jgi:hypothetical protein